MISQAIVPKVVDAPGRLLVRFAGRLPALIGAVLASLVVIAAIAAPFVSPFAPEANDFNAILAGPFAGPHPLGTDELGRDVLSRLIWGARASMQAGVFATLLAVAVAVPIGLMSGYWRGWWDAIIMRVTDTWLAFPFLILAVGLSAIFGPSLTNATVAIGVVQIPKLIRVTRGEVLSLREETFVAAAVADGAPDWYIAFRQILPNVTNTLLVQATVLIPYAILGESTLSFLGLGVQPPTPSWGVMLTAAQAFMSQAPWLAVAPGLAILCTTLSFNLVGDGLRDALDPERLAVSTLLETRDLSVRFTTDRGAVYALDSVSLSLQAEEVTAIVGESGCGKSVLAMSILGLAGPGATVSGSVLFEGVDLCRLSAGQLGRIRGKDIGIVFQEPMTALNPVLTAGSQVEEVLRRHEGLRPREARVRTLQLFEQVGISAPEQRANAYPHQLSGGMAQRVMIAMAIACRPRLLIADEPTTALDVTIQAGILRLLLDLRKRSGMSIMLITHDLGVVAEMADRVVVMYAGRAVEAAAVESIFSDPQHPYTIGLLGATRRPEWTPGSTRRRRLEEIPGMVPTRRKPADHCWFDERCPRADVWCSTHVPVLAPRRPEHLAACFHPGQAASRVVEPVPAVP